MLSMKFVCVLLLQSDKHLKMATTIVQEYSLSSLLSDHTLGTIFEALLVYCWQERNAEACFKVVLEYMEWVDQNGDYIP